MIQYLKETLKYTLRSKPLIKKEINHVQKLYEMSGRELEAYKETRFLHIFRQAITRSEFYKEFYKSNEISLRDIQSINDISKLPTLTKEIVSKHYRDILIGPSWKVMKANTSGTTGTPLTVFNDYLAIKTEQAYLWVLREKYGFIYGDRLVSLRGHLGHSKFKMFIHISNTLYLSSYNLNKEKAFEYYEEIKAFAPKAIEGYPSSLYNLCLLLKEKNLKLSIPLCFTSSESLFEFQRNLIEEYLSTRIYDYYGCTERTISLAEKIDSTGYFENPGYSHNEYYEDHILTTSLINNSFPLIRYKVNDRISLNHKNDIVSIDGRKEDYIICKDGSIVGRLDHIFKGAKNIKIAQIHQDTRGIISLNIVPFKNFRSNDQNYLLAKIDEKIGLDNIEVKFNLIQEDQILYTSRNKFKLVISTIDE